MKLPVEKGVFLLLLAAQERRQDGDTIQTIRCLGTGELGGGRQEVPECADMLADRSCLDLARPAGNQRDTDAAFVKIALVAAKRAGTVEELRVGPAFLVRAVVAAEE